MVMISMQCFTHHGLRQAYNMKPVTGETLHVELKYWVTVGVLDRPKKNLYNQNS